MPTNDDDFEASLLKAAEGAGEFQPYAHYDADHDLLTCYWSPDSDFARFHSQQGIVACYSQDTGELIGCHIPGFSKVVRAMADLNQGRVG